MSGGGEGEGSNKATLKMPSINSNEIAIASSNPTNNPFMHSVYIYSLTSNPYFSTCFVQAKRKCTRDCAITGAEAGD